MKLELAAALLLLAPTPALTHRLDEYLQATLISFGKEQLLVEMTLTPGVAVYPIVAAKIDTDADGAFSDAEQRAYVRQVLRDLSLAIDGHALKTRLLSMRFPDVDAMKQGLGAIRIEFQADLPRGGSRRKIVFANRHQSSVGAYLVNCLVPSDPEIRILAQNRNYSQSLYQLDYVRTGVPSESLLSGWWTYDRTWLGAVALLLFARFAFLWQRTRTADHIDEGRVAHECASRSGKLCQRLYFRARVFFNQATMSDL